MLDLSASMGQEKAYVIISSTCVVGGGWACRQWNYLGSPLGKCCLWPVAGPFGSGTLGRHGQASPPGTCARTGSLCLPLHLCGFRLMHRDWRGHRALQASTPDEVTEGQRVEAFVLGLWTFVLFSHFVQMSLAPSFPPDVILFP